MELHRTKSIALLLAGMAATVALAGLAWACTPQQYISAVRPAMGPAGTVVLVEGQAATPGLVELLWDGPTGSKIGEAVAGPNGSFSTALTIPSGASPNVYSIVASSVQAGLARTAFEVTAEATKAETQGSPGRVVENSTSDLWAGFSQYSGSPDAVNLTTTLRPSTTGPIAIAGVALLGAGLLACLAGLVAGSRVRTRSRKETTS